MITVLLTAHNEKDLAIHSVESIRENIGEMELSVILIDNASTDGLLEWATAQQDISYVYMDQGMEPWGSVLTQVCREFEIDTDIVVMQSGMVLLPGCLENLLAGLYKEEHVLAVGPLMPWAFNNTQLLPIAVGTVENAMDYIRNQEENGSGRSSMSTVLGLDCGLYMLKRDFITQFGGFDENIRSLYALSTMNALQIIRAGGKSEICTEAVTWCVERKLPEHVDTLSCYDEDMAYLEKCCGMHYFNISPNLRIVDLLDAPVQDCIRVLEIGCDCGATLLAVKNRFPHAYVCGCDICEEALGVAEHFVDNAFRINIEEENLPIEEASLDYIIFGDVLEHLHDPARTLRYVWGFLKPDGKVIASIPNLMHISVVRDLLCGNFTYTETGLLDKTHIHFFTFHEILKIFPQCGYTLEVCQDYCPHKTTQEEETLIDRLIELGSGTDRFMYTAFQYLVRAVKGRKQV